MYPRYEDASRLAERRGGWLGAQPLPDPQDLPEADYEGDDPVIEAGRPEMEWRAAA